MSNEIDFIDVFGKEDDRPKKNGWAPGGYTGKCSRCGELFIGDKRSRECADCAYESDKQFVEAVDKFRGSSSADLIKRTKERLEYAEAINRFSDVAYFKEVLEYLERAR